MSYLILGFLTGLSLVACFVVAESWLNDRANNRTRGKLLSMYMIIKNLLNVFVIKLVNIFTVFYLIA